MRLERATVEDVGDTLTWLRGLVPDSASVSSGVAEIVERVRQRGDAAVLALTSEHDLGGAEPLPLRVPDERIAEALAALSPDVHAALERAAANIRAVAEGWLSPRPAIDLPEGQRVVLREDPVDHAAVYVPGGKAPYVSSVLMGVMTAAAAGVGRISVCAPPGPDGEVHEGIRAATAVLPGVAVYRMGGAQAVAAFAHGTETVPRADVIVGPGNLWVQEAKRQVSGVVGIDGFAGPTDLMCLCAADADPRLVALDLAAQAEHGAASLAIAVSPAAAVLAEIAHELQALSAPDGVCALLTVGSLRDGLELAEGFAPEHLQLMGEDAEALAGDVRGAGCLFVGSGAGTAFGDYVAGSNHCLPTDGAARFASGLNPGHFRRRMAEVRIPPQAAARLAPLGAAIARVEGFEIHAKSMEARVRENGER